MQHSVDNIKMDIQTVGFSESPAIIAQVESELRRVMRFRQDIVAADVYLHEEGSNPENNKTVRWRLGIPGKDLFAEGSGPSWSSSLRDASEKLKRQFVD
ncbi:30S ribosomal protein S30 [Hymenobacter taeanensis]|uniref:30S ribosomal protein S30 n=1 Tax=Hymenobacter taeanensis TaxID=2735321 RepID=A0A6M6BLY8_9BACT|nr:MULTISPECIES: HPF/RaiA family ribosome-associated protein [Hymenobacter]QJX49002.1 30S ribosomal protein S30 [Hymenobacter taeanensis]UOQ81482.1 HPF/RaiA family ribosome-associated protein [Hymenobacter sp. 5414T-23]